MFIYSYQAMYNVVLAKYTSGDRSNPRRVTVRVRLGLEFG